MRPEIDITPSGDLAVFLGDRQLTFPATEGGLAAILRLLQARRERPRATIGFDAAPTQGMVEEWLRHHAVTRPGVKPDIADLLKEIEGLDL